MKFIEIREGFSVNMDEIISIEQSDDLSCSIYTQAGMEYSTFPYRVLLEILEKAAKDENPMNKKLDAFLSRAGHFAG